MACTVMLQVLIRRVALCILAIGLDYAYEYLTNSTPEPEDIAINDESSNV